MIARFVAGAVYAVNHDTKIGVINNCRTTDFDSALVNASDVSGLYTSGNLKYFVDMDTVFPKAPGPFTTSAGFNPPNTYPSG